MGKGKKRQRPHGQDLAEEDPISATIPYPSTFRASADLPQLSPSDSPSSSDGDDAHGRVEGDAQAPMARVAGRLKTRDKIAALERTVARLAEENKIARKAAKKARRLAKNPKKRRTSAAPSSRNTDEEPEETRDAHPESDGGSSASGPSPSLSNYSSDWSILPISTTDGGKASILAHNLPRLSVLSQLDHHGAPHSGKSKTYSTPLPFIKSIELHLRTSNIRESSWHKMLPTLVDDAYADSVCELSLRTSSWQSFKRGFVALFGKRSSSEIESALRRRWSSATTMDHHVVTFLTVMEEADLDARDRSALSAHYRDAFTASLTGWPNLKAQLDLLLATDPTTTVYELTQFAVKLAISLPLPTPQSRNHDKAEGSSAGHANKSPKVPAGGHRKRDRATRHECAYCMTKFPLAPATRFDHLESACRTKEADRTSSSTAAANVDNKSGRNCFNCGLPGHLIKDCPRGAGPVKPAKDYVSIQNVSLVDALPSPHTIVTSADADFAATAFLDSLEIPSILTDDTLAEPGFDTGGNSRRTAAKLHEGPGPVHRGDGAPGEPLCDDIVLAEPGFDTRGDHRRTAAKLHEGPGEAFHD